MFARVRMRRGMTVRRIVAAVGRAARLARAKMDPACAYFHTLIALAALRLPDDRDVENM